MWIRAKREICSVNVHKDNMDVELGIIPAKHDHQKLENLNKIYKPTRERNENENVARKVDFADSILISSDICPGGDS